MKEFFSVIISIVGGIIVGICLNQILSTKRNFKRNIILMMIGLILCIGNIILFDKIL